MVNKKVKASAFSVFMHEFISKERKHGRTYPSVRIWHQKLIVIYTNDTVLCLPSGRLGKGGSSVLESK